MTTPEARDTGVGDQLPASMAEIACSYFIRASMKCPASSTAQGAHIALSVLRSGHSPILLRDALLANGEMLAGIQKAAEAKHSPDQDEVTPDDVIKFVTQGFSAAQDLLLTLTEEKLRRVTEEIYPRHAAKPKPRFLNDLVWEETDKLIRGLI